MKIKYPFLLAVLCLMVQLSFAETEPNNTRNTANTLQNGVPDNGSISAIGDVDWWKITTTSDGDLFVYDSVTNSSFIYPQYCRVELYDNNGSTLILSAVGQGVPKFTAAGLAAGTYYIKISGDNNSIPDYVLSATLAAISNNDAGPNDTRAQAKLLPVSGSRSGHIGYYYNNNLDNDDWYKLTLPKDGYLNISMAADGNGNTQVGLYLYDNDGTTQLNSTVTYASGGTSNLFTNGLAAGTYYVRVNQGSGENYYYLSGWATYTLTSSFDTAGTVNDPEPNDAAVQAATLQSNDTISGHIGYYYNNKRDKNDWYKLILKNDGYLNLSFTRYNPQTDVYFYLYDGDGTTLLGSGNTISMDGLAAGAYYLQVNCGGSDGYYQYSGWSTYTIATSLSIYANASDSAEEPNNYYSQAKIFPANTTVTGHVGFYYNHHRDTIDYRKINYTGSGTLTLNASLNNWISNGQGHDFVLWLYKDTAAEPIYKGTFNNASGDVNITGLTKGYYIVLIKMYNWASEFGAYSLTNKFTQGKAKITVVSYDTSGVCASTNSIKYKCTQSSAPYTVQLYRYGVKYGSERAINKTTPFSFDNLPTGSYYATVYGDGATGNAKGKSDTVSIEPLVTGLNTTNITNNSAKLNWTKVNCAAYYTVEYKKHSVSTWIKKVTIGNKNFINISNLQANTQYDWSVAAVDSENNIISMGIYAGSVSFTTAASFIAGNNNEVESLSINGNGKNQIAALFTSPNPASSFFVIHFNNDKAQKLNAILYDETGEAVWSSGLINADALNNKQVNVSQFAKGIFYLKVINESGVVIRDTKIIVSK